MVRCRAYIALVSTAALLVVRRLTTTRPDRFSRAQVEDGGQRGGGTGDLGVPEDRRITGTATQGDLDDHRMPRATGATASG